MRILIAAASLAVAAGCAHSTAAHPLDANALVNAEDRTEADRALDQGRHPVAFIEFLQITSGMQVGELFSGGGYTTELLARAVGPTGVVYGQNPKWVLERFAEKPWSERLARPINARVVRVDRELDDPFPTEAQGKLDRVVSNANYHDAVWTNADRSKMNFNVLMSLKSGGLYVVCDSSSKPGALLEDVQTLHRIDEQVVRAEVLAAGFQFVREGSFLRNPEDTRDWNASPMAAGEKRGTSDRFCFAFAKP